MSGFSRSELSMQGLLHRLKFTFFPFQCVFAQTIPFVERGTSRAPPQLPIELWLEIFQFATYVHRSSSLKPLDPFLPRRISTNAMAPNTPALSIRTKLALVLVCKLWKRLAARFLYEHLLISSPARANAILKVLLASRTPSLEGGSDKEGTEAGHGRWAVHIEIFTHSRGSKDVRYLQTLFSIFQCCPNAKFLSGSWAHPLPKEFLEAVAKLYGPSLQGLYWNEINYKSVETIYTNTTPRFFDAFRNLRVLDLRHYVGDGPINSLNSESANDQPCLPYVTDLILSTRAESLQLASLLLLPRLCNLTVYVHISDCQLRRQPQIPYHDLRKFLSAHGNSLRAVDLPSPAPDAEPQLDSFAARLTVEHVKPEIFLEPETCPNLVSLTFPITSGPFSPQVHPRIQRIGVRGIRHDYLLPDKPTSSHLSAILNAITLESYPQLREIRTIGYLVDAHSDYLDKDVFLWWVERFERRGIDFLDGEGVLWLYTDSADEKEEDEVEKSDS